jgi:hypothetical protein
LKSAIARVVSPVLGGEPLMDILAFLSQLLNAIYAAIKILEHFGIKLIKGDGVPSDSSVPTRKKIPALVTAGIFLVLSFASASYGFYLVAHRPVKTVSCGLSFYEQSFTPKNSVWNSGLRVTITPDHEREHSQLLFIFDGSVGDGPRKGTVAILSQTGSFAVQSGEPLSSHPEVWNVKWATPVWTVNDSASFEFFSERPVHVKWVLPIIYNPPG